MATKKKKKGAIWDFLEPLENMLIVTVPQAVASGGEALQQTAAGILLLQEKEHIRATFGCVCKVLRAHETMEEKFPPGSGLLIHEHGGHPIFGDRSLTEAWIISEGDIMAKVTEDYWKHYAPANS